MEDRIINRGKDWFAFRKGMDDFIVRYGRDFAPD